MAVCPNPAISSSLLQEIWTWMQKGVCFTDIASRLCTRTVTNGYPYHTWTPGIHMWPGNVSMCDYKKSPFFLGKSETLADKMRSFLAQVEFSYQVCQWEFHSESMCMCLRYILKHNKPSMKEKMSLMF